MPKRREQTEKASKDKEQTEGEEGCPAGGTVHRVMVMDLQAVGYCWWRDEE